MTTEDVKALEYALKAGPTPGEWEVRAGPLGLHIVSDIEIEDGIESWVSVASMDELGAVGLADATYITAANPDRIRRILDALAEAEKRAEAAEADARRYLHLRDHADRNGLCAVRVQWWSEEYSAMAAIDDLWGAHLDAEVDAAIANLSKEPSNGR